LLICGAVTSLGHEGGDGVESFNILEDALRRRGCGSVFSMEAQTEEEIGYAENKSPGHASMTKVLFRFVNI